MICIKCGLDKNVEDFYFRKDTLKYRKDCKKCVKENSKKNGVIYRQENRLIELKRGAANREKNKDILKIQRDKNKNSKAEYDKQYRKNNKTIIMNKNLKYQKRKRQEDPIFRLRTNISSQIFKALKKNAGSKNGFSILKYLPYTIDELKIHIEKQFKSWMNWNNQGIYKSDIYKSDDNSTWTWHLDHIIPQTQLLYSNMNEENFRKCWALNNLRPFKSIDNIKKGNK